MTLSKKDIEAMEKIFDRHFDPIHKDLVEIDERLKKILEARLKIIVSEHDIKARTKS